MGLCLWVGSRSPLFSKIIGNTRITVLKKKEKENIQCITFSLSGLQIYQIFTSQSIKNQKPRKLKWEQKTSRKEKKNDYFYHPLHILLYIFWISIILHTKKKANLETQSLSITHLADPLTSSVNPYIAEEKWLPSEVKKKREPQWKMVKKAGCCCTSLI